VARDFAANAWTVAKDGMIPGMWLRRHFPRLLLLVALCFTLASQGADRSQFQKGLAAYRAEDFQTAGKIWTELAKQGDPAASFNLGVMYDQGQGFGRDAARAIELYRVAAEKGYAPAQFNLGASYHQGQGVKQDAAEAAKWWRRAAEQGFLQAQYNLGTLYYYGQGVPKDLKEAAHWFRLAAEQGDAGAREVLHALQSKLAARGEPATAGKSESGRGRPAPRQQEGLRREPWLQAQPPDHYTIQIFANWTEQSIVRFVKDHGLQDKAAYFGARFEDRPWYSLVYGDYPSMAAAERAMAALPAELRITSPWIRSFAEIQKVLTDGVINARPARGVADMLALEQSPGEQAPSGVVNVGGVTVLIPQIDTARRSEAASSGGATPKSAGVAAPERVAQSAKPPAETAARGAHGEEAVPRAAGAAHEKGPSWVARQPADHYTIQVFADSRKENAEDFIRRNGLGGHALWFESLRNDEPWYSVVYGSYPDISRARKALAELPAALRAGGAWVRGFGGIQQAMTAGQQSGVGKVAKGNRGAVQTAEPAASAATGRVALPAASSAPESPPRRLGGEERTRHLAQGQAAFNRGSYKEAFTLWEPLAKMGVTQAQYDLGFLYESGWGVARDYEKAARWYRLAANSGDMRATFNLGVMVLEGLGTDADYALGLELVTQAAENGHRKAQEFLAEAYRKGRYGLTQDDSRAARWEHRAVSGFQ
jgi:TPR repeat protein